jgi:hypothetical protein
VLGEQDDGDDGDWRLTDPAPALARFWKGLDFCNNVTLVGPPGLAARLVRLIASGFIQSVHGIDVRYPIIEALP